MRWKVLIILLILLPLAGRGQPAVDAKPAPGLITERFSGTGLPAVFSLFEKKYGLKLAYEEAAVKDIRVTCRLEGAEVDKALETLLRGTPLEYRMVDARHVLIRPVGQRQEEMPSPPAFFTLRGRITDAVSGEPLPFATILVAELETGVAADESGVYALSLPLTEEELVLQVQYVGYATRLLRLPAGETPAELAVSLYPRVQEIAGITVQERYPLLSAQPEAGRWRIDAEQLMQAMPSFVGGRDLFRSLQLLPGVGAADDLSAGLQVRGGDSEENLILFDGITLYRLDHFYGVFSALNPDVVGEVEFYKNAFPARYGGRTASVIDMHSRQTGDRAGGGAELNLLTSQAYLKAPLGGDIHLLLGGRMSNGDISGGTLFDRAGEERVRVITDDDPLSAVNRQALLAQTPDFRFYDANGRLEWRPAEGRGSIAFNVFHSYDRYVNAYETTYRQFLRSRVVNFDEQARWTNTGFSLQAANAWNDRLSSRLTLSRSDFHNENGLETSLITTRALRSDSVGAANANANGITGYDLQLDQTWRAAEGYELGFGYQAQRQSADVDLMVDNVSILQRDQQAWEHAGYGELRASPVNNLTLRAGLRTSWYEGTRRAYFSPRLLLRYEPLPGLGVQGSWSRYYQFLREVDYENRFGNAQPFFVLADGLRFPVAASGHLSAGLNYTGEGWAAELEYFNKNTDGVLEYALLSTGFDRDREEPARRLEYASFTGRGRTYGLDALLRKTSGAYTGWIAYTLSRSTNSFAAIYGGQPFPSANDRRHQLKVVQQYELGPWQFAATYVFASGRPYTNLADLLRLSRGPADRRETPPADRIQYLDDYHRVDLGTYFSFRLGGATARAGLSIFNLLNRENVKYRQYVFAIPEGQRAQSAVVGSELRLLDRTVNVSLGAEF